MGSVSRQAWTGAIGDYITGDLASVRRELRNYFLDLLAREQPRILPDLQRRGLDLNIAASDAGDLAEVERIARRQQAEAFDRDQRFQPLSVWAAIRYLVPGEQPRLDRLREALVDWSSAYNLDGEGIGGPDWLYDAALLTLAHWRWSWRQHGRLPELLEWQLLHAPLQIVDAPVFRFHYTDVGMDPLLTTREQRRSAAIKALTDALDYHERTALGPFIEGRQYVKPVARRDVEKHLCWLIRFQINRWSQSQIAKDASVSRIAVLKKINELAELLELPIRRPEPYITSPVT